MVREWGNVGFIVAAIAMFTFTVLFFVFVRWTRDTLGRVLAGVFGPVAAIMVTATARLLGVPIPAYMWVRAVLFSTMALGIVAAVATFVWSSIWAPHHKKKVDR